MMEKKRLFVSHAEEAKWEGLQENRFLADEPGVQQIKNGIVLPLKRRDDITQTADGIFKGGVCTETFVFVAGLQRDNNKDGVNLSCCQGYIVAEDELDGRHETVVFGGVLQWHFGNMLVNTTTRLWWYTEHQDTPYTFVFIHDEEREPCEYREFFELLGLPSDRIEIIHRPTKFDNVIVPEEACYIISQAHPKWLQVFELMKNHVRQQLPKSNLEKIYLSRTLFNRDGNKDEFNEEYYENFYKKRGFAVIHPETLPLREQINLIMYAREIVCIIGTLSHMALFAENRIKLVCLLRRPTFLPHQALINELKKLDWYWIEASKNPLPIPHDKGVVIYYPTKYFKNYLDCGQEPYQEGEVPIEIPPESMIMAFLESWAQRFSDTEYYWRIKDKPVFDFVDALANMFFDKELDKSLYPATKNEIKIAKQKESIEKQRERIEKQRERIEKQKERIEKQKERIEKQESEIKRLRNEIIDMKNSNSWKLTKPLRFLNRKLFK